VDGAPNGIKRAKMVVVASAISEAEVTAFEDAIVAHLNAGSRPFAGIRRALRGR
jgi:hypothetical protein